MIIRVGPRFGERLQLQNPYIVRELAGANDEVKQPHRESVAQFFAAHQATRRHPRCFCLPGARWAFENELERHLRRPVEFVGVERNYTIVECGLRYMPGRHQLYDRFETRDRTFIGYSTDRAKIVWSDASAFMGVARKTHVTRRQRVRWASLYKGWTCAWLDFCGPIGDELITCCKRLENYLDVPTPTVPIAVTFLIGREAPEVTRWLRFFSAEDDSTITARATFLRVLWESNRYRTATIADSWTYKSAGGVTMGVVTALLTRK